MTGTAFAILAMFQFSADLFMSISVKARQPRSLIHLLGRTPWVRKPRRWQEDKTTHCDGIDFCRSCSSLRSPQCTAGSSPPSAEPWSPPCNQWWQPACSLSLPSSPPEHSNYENYWHLHCTHIAAYFLSFGRAFCGQVLFWFISGLWHTDHLGCRITYLPIPLLRPANPAIMTRLQYYTYMLKAYLWEWAL